MLSIIVHYIVVREQTDVVLECDWRHWQADICQRQVSLSGLRYRQVVLVVVVVVAVVVAVAAVAAAAGVILSETEVLYFYETVSRWMYVRQQPKCYVECEWLQIIQFAGCIKFMQTVTTNLPVWYSASCDFDVQKWLNGLSSSGAEWTLC